jgi:hypothetical protein
VISPTAPAHDVPEGGMGDQKACGLLHRLAGVGRNETVGTLIRGDGMHLVPFQYLQNRVLIEGRAV